MNKNTKALIVSVIVLILIGAGLFWWVTAGNGEDSSARTENTEQDDMEKSEGENADNEVAGESAESEDMTADEGQAGSKDATAEGQNEPESGTEQEKEVQKPVTMVFSGDILLSSYVLNNYESSGITGVLSEELLGEMQNADLTMVNEEFPFSTRGTQAPDKQFTFRVEPSYVKLFQEMGIDVVTIANNHALDYGTDALSDTFQTLDDAGIAYVGAGDSKERAAQAYTAEMGGKTFGFLAASRVIPVAGWNIENQQPGMLCTYDSMLLCEAIRETKANCDYVVVYVHWGIERENTPQEYQRQLAKAYIDAGADMVIGSHPHVLQGIEYYNGKPVVYSLGNYIFNQNIEKTMLLKATVSPENETTLQLIPASAVGAKTKRLEGEEAKKLFKFVEDISFDVSVGEDGSVFQQ